MIKVNANAIKTGRRGGKRTASVLSGLGLQLQTFTLAELSAVPLLASQNPGAIVACSNGNVGAACLAFSDGTAWKVIARGATIN